MHSLLGLMFDHVVNFGIWLVLGSWVFAAFGAAIYYVFQYPSTSKSVNGFVSFILPSELWKHPSCRRDYVYAAVNRFVEPFTVGMLLISAGAISTGTYYVATTLFGPIIDERFSWTIWMTMIVITLIIQDFFTWYAHYLEHKIPALWEVHKVHHSAEFLNPLSNRRHHPLQLVWEVGVSNMGAGVVLGVVSYVMHVPVLDNMCLGADAYFIGNALSFSQLRHSHIPLHYGRWEKWLLSPAQHILHHSVEVQDWDINYGLLSSAWDRMFKTIRYSVPGYRFRTGLQPEYQSEYSSIVKFYTTPLVNLAKMAWQTIPRDRSTVTYGIDHGVENKPI